MIYQRICLQGMCGGCLLLALTVKMVLATGADQTAGSIVSNLATNESFISWMLYLEMGQVYSAREASDLAQEAVLAAQQTPQAPSRNKPPSVPDQTVDRDDPPPQADPPEIQTEDPPASRNRSRAGTSRTARPASAQEPGPEQDPPSQGQTDPSGVQASAPTCGLPRRRPKGISIAGACGYEVDKLELLNKTLDLEFTGQEPTVLIVHTHSSEAYTQETGWEYEESDRAENPGHRAQRNQSGRGDRRGACALTVSVIHDTSINDYPSYNGAYTRTPGTHQRVVAPVPQHSNGSGRPPRRPGGRRRHAAGIRGYSGRRAVVPGHAGGGAPDEGGLEHPSGARIWPWPSRFRP